MAKTIIQNKEPLTLSIIIPAYNEEDYIAACLDSIAAQTVAANEVILVDNNSTDNTVEIAKSYPFVRVVKESRQGRVFARNSGFKANSSELAGRIDADTRLPRDWVENVLRYYSDPAHAGHTITGGADFYNLPFKYLTYNLHKLAYFRLNSAFLGFQNLFGSNMVIPKSILGRIIEDSCKVNDYHEDIDLSIHAHEAGKPAFFREELRVHVALRGIWSQREGAESNRFIIWRDTLRRHGVESLPNEAALGILIFLSTALLGIQTFARSTYSRLTD
jgi:glycosyltransferase involved in cell wall biosynthesis